jgi:serine/threonine protein phosphatase PrpC
MPKDKNVIIRSYSEPIKNINQPCAISASDPGYGRNKKPYSSKIPYTEDRCCKKTWLRPDGKIFELMWIADGHGGDTVVQIVYTRFGLYFDEIANSFLGEQFNVTDILLMVFERIHFDLNKRKLEFSHCGSTLTTCVIDMETKMAYFANLGDSVCQVIRDEKCIFRTRDQDASSNIEQKRILEVYHNADCNVTVKQLFGFSDNFNVWRFLPTGIIPLGGFGDYASDKVPGCIRRIPEISTLQLIEGDIVILSSDGLFEVMNTNILTPGRDESEIVHNVISYKNNPLQNVDLSTYLIQEHISSLIRQAKNHPRFIHLSIDDIRNIILNAKDNCSVITFEIPIEHKLMRCISS